KATHMVLIKSRKVLAAALAHKGVSELRSIREESDPIQWLDGVIQVGFGGGETLSIAMESTRPDEPAVLVHAVMEAYMKEVVRHEEDQRTMRVHNLKQTADIYLKKMNERRKELEKLTEALGAGDPKVVGEIQINAIQSREQARKELDSLDAELRKAQRDVAAYNARLRALPDAPIPDEEFEKYVGEDSTLSEMSSQLEEARKTYEDTLEKAVRGE